MITIVKRNLKKIPIIRNTYYQLKKLPKKTFQSARRIFINILFFICNKYRLNIGQYNVLRITYNVLYINHSKPINNKKLITTVNTNNKLPPIFSKKKSIIVHSTIPNITTLKDVITFPCKDGIYDPENGNYLLTERYTLDDSLSSSEMQQLINVSLDRKYIYRLKDITPLSTIDKGLHLLGSLDNYWHFLIEEAPKVLMAKALSLSPSIPILIPADLNPNLFMILDIINVENRRIIKVPSEYVKIHQLYHIEDYLKTPLHPRNMYGGPPPSINLERILSISPGKLKISLSH